MSLSPVPGRVIVTRDASPDCRLCRTLDAAGVATVVAPVLEKHALAVPQELQAFASWMPGVTVAAWTSPHAVGVLLALAPDARRWLQPVRQVAVGEATADAVEAAGWSRPEIASEAVAEGVVEWIHRYVAPEDCLLWAHSADARSLVRDAAQSVGASLIDWSLYAARPSSLPQAVYKALAVPVRSVVTLSSAMTATAWAEVVRTLPAGAEQWPVVTIGPLTTRAALASGLRVLKEAPEARLEALAETAIEVLAQTTHRP